MFSFHRRKSEQPPSDEEIINALQVAFDTSDVKIADPIYDGERLFHVGDVKLVSVFDNDNEFHKFYIAALEEEIFDSPGAVIEFCNEYLGKNKWTEYIPNDKLAKTIISIIENTKKSKITDELKKKIEEQPTSFLKSFFNMGSSNDRKEFYSFILYNCDKKLFADAVEAALQSTKSIKFYLPISDYCVKAYEWKK